MSTFDVKITDNMDVPGVDPDSVQATLERALLAAGETARAVWVKRAEMKGLRDTGGDSYLTGITPQNARVEISESKVQGHTVTVSVDVVNTSPRAALTDDGHEAFHLPSKIKWPTARTKTTKTGRMYLDVPFRHYANASAAEADAKGYLDESRKRMLPADVYAKAKKLGRTIRMNAGLQYDEQGRYIAADKYRYGTPSRLTGDWKRRNDERVSFVPGLNKRYEGLMKTGPVGHSQYLTIRKLFQDSPGWNIPAKEGLHIAQDVAEVLPQVVGPAIQAELAGLLDE